MLLQLRELQLQRQFELITLDVDGDQELAARYGTLVPVLVSEQRVICSYYLDPVAVTGFLDGEV